MMSLLPKDVKIDIATLTAKCMEGVNKGEYHIFWQVDVRIPKRERAVEIVGRTPHLTHREAIEGLLTEVDMDRRFLPKIRDEVRSLAQHVLDTRQYEANDEKMRKMIRKNREKAHDRGTG